jgi:hypothetical protein
MMTSNNGEATSPDALAEQARRPSARHADPPTHLLALFPSPDQLRNVAAGRALTASDRSEAGAGDLAAPLGVPRALLNPLESLPHLISIDDVKKQVHAVTATHTTQAY